MNQRYALFCDAASKTENGKMILHGIFDRIYVEKEPTVQEPSVHAMMSFAFEVEQLDAPQGGEAVVEFVHESSGTSIFSTKGSFDVTAGAKDKVASVIPLAMFPLIGIGRYRAKLSINGTELPGSSFVVELVKK